MKNLANKIAKKWQNQVNPPQKKKDKSPVDENWKIYIKKDGNSFLLFDKLSGSGAEIRKNALLAMYKDWKGKLIVTR